MDVNEENIYKLNTKNQGAFREELKSDLENNLQKFNDPVVLGELMYKLLEERENTNRILKNILMKLEARAAEAPALMMRKEDILVPEIDERILEFAKHKGRITAEDVRAEFNYKGKNGASARLNRLYELSLLGKKQVGKKVFFFPRD